jgi:hypothetical protein
MPPKEALVTAVKTAPDASSANGKPDEKKPDEVLDLVSLIPTRRLVKLPTTDHPEGENFELRLVEDFGIEMQQKLLAWSRKFSTLMAKAQEGDELDDNENTRLRFVLDGVFENVLQTADGKELSEAKRKKLNDTARQRVVQAFSWGPTLARQQFQTALITRLVEKEYLTQEHVDEVMDEMREQLVADLSTSAS